MPFFAHGTEPCGHDREVWAWRSHLHAGRRVQRCAVHANGRRQTDSTVEDELRNDGGHARSRRLFQEGCLAGLENRTGSATAITPSVIGTPARKRWHVCCTRSMQCLTVSSHTCC